MATKRMLLVGLKITTAEIVREELGGLALQILRTLVLLGIKYVSVDVGLLATRPDRGPKALQVPGHAGADEQRAVLEGRAEVQS